MKPSATRRLSYLTLILFNMSPLGFASAIGAAVVWGIVYTLDQKILKNTSPLTLLLLNSLLTCGGIAPLLVIREVRVKILDLHEIQWTIVVASLVLAAFANLLIFSAIKALGASTASTFEIMYPVFVVLFSAIFLHSRPTTAFLIGSALVLCGSVIIVFTM